MLCFPLAFCYCIYSVIYNEHKVGFLWNLILEIDQFFSFWSSHNVVKINFSLFNL
jgi:hypothetical protein